MSNLVSTDVLGPSVGTAASGVLFRRRNTSMFVLSSLTFCISWLIAALFGVPAERGFDGSLLTQPSIGGSIVALFAVAAAIAINVFILKAVLGRAPGLEILFGVSVGVLAFSVRGGSTVDLMQYHGNSIYVVLILETLLLFAGLAAVWPWLRPVPTAAVEAPQGDPQSKLTSLAVVAVVMILLMHLLCQTPSKRQAIFSVAISAFGGATVAFAFLGEMSVEPYLLAPVVVAVAGYAMALFGGASPTGTPTQVLAFPLPLDYVGAGTAGALFGYWTGLGWKQDNERDA